MEKSAIITDGQQIEDVERWKPRHQGNKIEDLFSILLELQAGIILLDQIPTPVQVIVWPGRILSF